MKSILFTIALLVCTASSAPAYENAQNVPHFIPDHLAVEVPDRPHPIYPRYPDMGPPHYGYHYYDGWGQPYRPRSPGWGHSNPAPGYGHGQGPMYRYWYDPHHGWGFRIGPNWRR